VSANSKHKSKAFSSSASLPVSASSANASASRCSGLPEWGGQPVKRLYLFLEDGRGDILLTLRYLDQIRARGVEEIIACMKPRQYEPDFTEFLRAQPWMPPIVWNPDALANHKIEYAIGSGGIECCLGATP
jgi:hypothetical protein